MQWYESLHKPVWTPDPETISVIWQILYPIILFSFSYVFFKAFRGKIPRFAALPFAINLIANVAFTPILFGVRSLLFASFDIVVVLVTLFWGMGMIWRYCRWVAIVQVPYLIWVAIATTLQLAITQMNVISP
jgi:tryptophan-rich sensory protein